jgi:uncharacterized protein
MMQLRQFDNISEFWHKVQAYLLRHAAENNLLLGILHTLLHNPERYPDPPYLVMVEKNGDIIAVAIRTPPRKLLLAKAADPTALKLIAQDFYQQPIALPGFMGLVPEAEVFGKEWQSLTGQSSRVTVAMRIHQLTTIPLAKFAPGSVRLATESDRSLLRQWVMAFSQAIGENHHDVEKVIDSGLKLQNIYLWEDLQGVPVSITAGRAANAIARISLVYTPPEYRRQGYATAAVAAVSKILLAQGYQKCFLLTDLANPTSNHIYREIGYQAVCDWQEYSILSTS